nr:MAG TPA: tail protein [Caudoviricetes sp.]
MELNIYNQSGELKLTASVTSSSAWNLELMRENALSLTFTIPVCVPLQVNDYIILEGVRFSVKKEYKPRKKNSQKYSYSVKFYAPIHDAQQVVYLHLTDGQYEPQFSLDGSPREHLQKWVDNMNRIYGEERWRIGDVIDAPNQNIEYSNTTCWDALASMADIFSTEWWSDGFYINLCRCERGERVELGYGKGLTSLTQTENSDDVKFFTRLIPLGSTRNIDRSRYGFSRLQLPDRAKYVDRNTDYGLYEHVEEDAFAGIFPHYTGTVSSVRSQERTGNDGKPFTVYYFKDEGLEFDPCDYEIAGLVKQLSFQSGELNGRDFEANYHSESKEWEIINTYPDEDTQLPGGNLIPHAGDKYIPWNFRMPEAYEKQAEQDYKAAVDDFLSSYSEDTTKYGGDTDYTYIEKHSVPLRLGQSVRLLSEEYFLGIGYRDTRMTKVTRKLENLSMAAIECTNRVGKGWKRSLESDLNGLQYVVGGLLDRSVIEVLKSWDNREASEYNVFSALRTIKEITRRAISKIGPDGTSFLVSFLGGAWFGEFVDSMIAGKGAGIFPDGRAQVERLEVRGSLSVLDLIINQIQGLESDYSFTEIGKIESVEDLGENTYRLKIEKRTDFDFMKFQENDVCFSITNTLLTGRSDYYTSWMRILTTNAQENSITVVLYPDSEVPGGTNYPPLAGYNVTRRGNSTLPETGGFNERAQSWMISSREGRIMFLSNVYKPILEDYNYALTIGKLPNIKALEKLPVTTEDVGIVAQTVIAEKFYQFDYNGDVVPNKVDRGVWSLETAQSGAPYRFVQHELSKPSGSEYTLLEQHTVYHLGCKWGCLKDKTTDEPKWNSPSWGLLEGDSRYSLQLSLSGGEAFVIGGVDTVMSGRIYFGTTDITDDVMADGATEVEWFRDSGNVPADNLWTPDYVDGNRLAIHIDNGNQHGVGSDFGFVSRSVAFICRVFIPVEGEIQQIEQRFGFDIL